MKEEFKTEIDNYIKTHSKNKVEELSKYINRKKKQKYPDHKIKKIGDLSKEVSNKELKLILNHEKKDKIKLAYIFMFKMGLRVSEVVRINKKDIFETKLNIQNIKCDRIDTRTIPNSLNKILIKFLKEHKNKIKENKGFLFYSENPTQNNYHINENWLRNHFRETTLELKINKVYNISKDGRNLYLFSSHSGRHSFCMRFYRKSNFDVEKTKIAMRLKSLDTLQHYLKTNMKEVDKIMFNI